MEMFSLQELVAAIPSVVAVNSPPLEIVQFGNYDFESPCSEQSISVFDGRKGDFADWVTFWIRTLQAQDLPTGEYAASALCEPITEEEFTRVIKEYSNMLRPELPVYLQEIKEYRSGLRMYGDWNDVAITAELSEAFIAFYWSTSA
jgi:hypothetical protein